MPDEPSRRTQTGKHIRLSAIGGNSLAGAAALLWAGVVYAGYYVVHKPFTSSNLEAIGAVFVTLIAWLASLVVIHALGRVVPFGYEGYSASERMALRLGLGFGLLSLALLVLGWLPLYRPLIAWGVLLVGVPLGVKGFTRDLKALVLKIPSSRHERLLAGFVLLMLVFAFILALVPPTAWDSLVYHLTGPKLYLEARELNHDIDLPYLGFPNGGSMLFLWGLMLSGPELAQLFHFTFALLSLVLVLVIANQLAPGGGWLACALLIGVPSAALLASWAYVEWLAMFAGLAAFRLLIPRKINGEVEGVGLDPSALVLAGVFAGMALSAKYTSIGLVVGLLLVVAIQRRRFSSILLFGAIAVAFVSPFLLKNLALTGNPIYPFFFEGKFWDADRAFWYSRSGTGLNLIEVVLAPWEATIWGVEGAVVEGHRAYGATIGPALLTLIPFGIAGLRSLSASRRELLRTVLVVGGSAYAVWIVLLTFSDLLVQSRLLFPALPFMALLAIHGFHSLANLGKPGKSVQFVLGGLIAFGLALTVFARFIDTVGSSPIPILFGAKSEREYLVEELGAFQIAMEEINELPPGSKVRFLWEPRSYYCSDRMVCEPDALLDRWWHSRRSHGDEDRIAEAWDSDGVTHVLLFQVGAQEIRDAGFDPLTEADWESLARFVDRYLEAIPGSEGAYTLYRFSPHGPDITD
ncbi:MAG: hypothetical protein ACE5M4_03845 [Anaerolineales bacterium]